MGLILSNKIIAPEIRVPIMKVKKEKKY